MIARRLAFMFAVAAASSGCASLQSALSDEPADAPAPVVKTTPEAAYNAGLLDMVRGDAVSARHEWNRCLAMSAPDSPSRVDCLVALERMESPSSVEP